MLMLSVFAVGCATATGASTTEPPGGQMCVALPIEPADTWLLDYDQKTTMGALTGVDAWADQVLLPSRFDPIGVTTVRRDGQDVAMIVACRRPQLDQWERWKDAICASKRARSAAWVAKGWPALPMPGWCSEVDSPTTK